MDQQKPAPDEIDLGSLFKKLGNAIQSVWIGALHLLATLRRVPFENKTSFIGILCVSVALAVAYSFLLKREYYESTLILNSSQLNKRLLDNAIEKLDALANETNKAGLAKALNISETLAANILGFEAKPFVTEEEIIDLALLRDRLKKSAEGNDGEAITQLMERIQIDNRHSFEIKVRTLVPEAIPNLQEAIVGYLKNNDFVKRRLDINRTILQERKVKLTAELQKLDSLKGVIFDNYKKMAVQGREGSNNVILSDRAVTNPVEIFNQDMAMYNEMKAIDISLYLEPEFELVDGFTEFSEPASPGIVKLIAIAFLLGFVIAYMDVAIRAFNKYLSKFD